MLVIHVVLRFAMWYMFKKKHEDHQELKNHWNNIQELWAMCREYAKKLSKANNKIERQQEYIDTIRESR